MSICVNQWKPHRTAPGEGLWEGGQLLSLTLIWCHMASIPPLSELPLEPSTADPPDGMRGLESPQRSAFEALWPQKVGAEEAINRTAEWIFPLDRILFHPFLSLNSYWLLMSCTNTNNNTHDPYHPKQATFNILYVLSQWEAPYLHPLRST